MNNRTLRRAAERQARKNEQKRPQSDPNNHLDFAPEPSCAGAQTALSPARLAANRANAALSTGPTSETGRTISSLNALKTGLTGRTILLPSDDVEGYQAHLARFEAQWKPLTDPERALLQSIADTEWRLLRIPSLESGIYALGRLEFAAESQDHPALIDTKIFLTYQRQLNNLSIQENRLRRQRDKDVTQLKTLQQERVAKEKAQLATLPVSSGFEFSTREFEQADAQHVAFRAEAIAKICGPSDFGGRVSTRAGL